MKSDAYCQLERSISFIQLQGKFIRTKFYYGPANELYNFSRTAQRLAYNINVTEGLLKGQ